MAPPFPFEPLLIFGFLSLMLLFGLLVRAVIPFFQKFLFPASLITYLFLVFITRIFSPDVAGMLWGFFFLFGLVFAVILRSLAARTSFSRLMNPPLQRRITGFSVDYLIVATGSGIELLVLQKYLAPLIAIALTALLNAPFWWDWSTFATSLVFAGILFVALVLLLNRKLWHNL